MHRRLALLAFVGLAACSEAPTVAPAPGGEASLAVSAVQAPGFIVTVRDGVNPAAVAADHGVSPQYMYRHALNGFAGSMSEAARSGLLRDARVTRVEADGIATTMTTQSNATWGLDRIDQRNLPLNGTFVYTNTGSGVNAYIIDTGIRYDHVEFGVRAVKGFDAVTSGGTAADCNGHGTHVAGTVGGTVYGVAKATKLYAVRVLDCSGSGTWSGVIAGVDWVTANHVKPAVANMSLGGGANSSVDDAVANSIAAGVTYAIAAGNGNQGGRAQDACKYSPARVPAAITVSATNNTDTKATWANYGTCVDIFAPGVSITSAWHTGSSDTRTISGTSMAAPHVAGVAALYLQGNPGASPATVTNALVANATTGVVKSAGSGSPNRLLFTNY